MALLDSLTGTTEGVAKDSLTTKKYPTVDDIEEIAGKLPDSNIRDVLLANIASGKKDIANLRDGLAGWFDSAMDRLSGDYKRDLKWLSLFVGIVVSTVFNADSVRVSRALWSDATLRSNIVSAASQIVAANDSAAAVEKKQCKESDPQKQTACLLERLKTDQDRLRPFPIGWPDMSFKQALEQALPGTFAEPTAPQPAAPASAVPPTKPAEKHPVDAFWIVLMKVLGLAWTGVALSLGAPFWFDLLAKFMNIRGTGTKPKDKTKTA